MNLEKYRDHPLFVPILWSVNLHIVFIILAMFIHLRSNAEIPEKSTPFFNVKSVETSPVVYKKESTRGARQFADITKIMVQAHATSAGSVKDVPLRSVMEKKVIADETSREVAAKNVEMTVSPGKEPSDIHQLVVETEERELTERVQVKEKPTTGLLAQFSQRIVSGSKQGDQNFLQTLQKALGGERLYSPRNVGIDAAEGMPGFTPMGAEGQGLEGLAPDRGIGEPAKAIMKYEALDEFLDIEVYTYEEPGDPQKYYMIKIFAKPGARAFKVMPKEILFTVDASLSISPERLDEFKKGIRACLSHLNKGDVFNIVAFKDKTTFLAPSSLSANSDTIKKAERFVSSLTSSERTDVYQAFDRIVQLPLSRTPSNVILISDGRPTHGVVNSRELITSVSRINKKVRPVFAFSGGAKVNRYLLDFIAYQNRAWSQYVKNKSDIDTGLAEFYEKIKDPLFLNLKYRLNALDEKEAFPKSLPDFYKGAEFTLYGAYKDEDKFSMQLLGDVEGKTKELIFSRSLKEAKKGNEDIKRGYGFNKIYYLISRATVEGPRPEILREIDELSRRYGIVTPYSPELEETD